MRVLLTGSSGWLGRHLAPRLVAAGHEVVGLDRAIGDLKGGAISLYQYKGGKLEYVETLGGVSAPAAEAPKAEAAPAPAAASAPADKK